MLSVRIVPAAKFEPFMFFFTLCSLGDWCQIKDIHVLDFFFGRNQKKSKIQFICTLFSCISLVMIQHLKECYRSGFLDNK